MSDILMQHQGAGVTRYADQGDGTFAEVVHFGATGALAVDDVLIRQQNGAVIRYRDMGDGTWAEVVQS
jgi:hypothetical protein